MKSRPIGKCKMCLHKKPLARSHLIPARVYRYCGKGQHKPIMIARGIVLPTDEQVWAHLLCDDCETILNNGGERWTVGKLLAWEKTFPLYDLVTQKKPNFDADGALIYFAAKNPQIQTQKLTHFALGIFWKASVNSWGSDADPLIELGPYSEKIRLWLRSEREFPEHVYLSAIVSQPERTQPSFCPPLEMVGHGCQRFDFHVPGLSFVLNVGKTVDEGIRVLSVHTPPHAIHVADWQAKSEQLLLDNFQRNRKPKAFWTAMERIGRDGRKPK